MKLKLTKPIVFFDLETTGINPAKDRVVQISLLKISPDGREELKTFLVNPQMPIPPQATAVHGISDDDVKKAPVFAEIAKEIIEIIKNLKFMLMVFRSPIKANPRISFYQVKIMLFHGVGRKNSGACSLNLERR